MRTSPRTRDCSVAVHVRKHSCNVRRSDATLQEIQKQAATITAAEVITWPTVQTCQNTCICSDNMHIGMSEVHRCYSYVNSNSVFLAGCSLSNDLALLVATVQSELLEKCLKDVDIYFDLKFIPGKKNVNCLWQRARFMNHSPKMAECRLSQFRISRKYQSENHSDSLIWFFLLRCDIPVVYKLQCRKE